MHNDVATKEYYFSFSCFVTFCPVGRFKYICKDYIYRCNVNVIFVKIFLIYPQTQIYIYIHIYRSITLFFAAWVVCFNDI